MRLNTDKAYTPGLPQPGLSGPVSRYFRLPSSRILPTNWKPAPQTASMALIYFNMPVSIPRQEYSAFLSACVSSKGSISFSPKESPICGNGHLGLLKGRLRTYSSAPDGSEWLPVG